MICIVNVLLLSGWSLKRRQAVQKCRAITNSLALSALSALKVGHEGRDLAAENDADLADEVHRVGGPRQEREREGAAVLRRKPCDERVKCTYIRAWISNLDK